MAKVLAWSYCELPRTIFRCQNAKYLLCISVLAMRPLLNAHAFFFHSQGQRDKPKAHVDISYTCRTSQPICMYRKGSSYEAAAEAIRAENEKPGILMSWGLCAEKEQIENRKSGRWHRSLGSHWNRFLTPCCARIPFESVRRWRFSGERAWEALQIKRIQGTHKTYMTLA